MRGDRERRRWGRKEERSGAERARGWREGECGSIQIQDNGGGISVLSHCGG